MEMNAPFSFGGPAPISNPASATPMPNTLAPDFGAAPPAPPEPEAPMGPPAGLTINNITDQHMEILINAILSKVSSAVSQMPNIMQMATSVVPLVEAVAKLHTALSTSMSHKLEAMNPQNDPRFEQQLQMQEMKHQMALDIMSQHFEEQKARQDMEIASRKAEAELQIIQQKAELEQFIAEQKAKHDEKMAQLDAASKVQTIQQADDNHEQNKAQQEEKHSQTLSNTDEMHEVQVEQAAKPQASDISGN